MDASTAETTHAPPHQVSHPQPLYADCRWLPSDSRSCCKSSDRVRAVITCYGRDNVEPTDCGCDRVMSCSPPSCQLLCIAHQIHSGISPNKSVADKAHAILAQTAGVSWQCKNNDVQPRLYALQYNQEHQHNGSGKTS